MDVNDKGTTLLTVELLEQKDEEVIVSDVVTRVIGAIADEVVAEAATSISRRRKTDAKRSARAT